MYGLRIQALEIGQIIATGFWWMRLGLLEGGSSTWCCLLHWKMCEFFWLSCAEQAKCHYAKRELRTDVRVHRDHNPTMWHQTRLVDAQINSTLNGDPGPQPLNLKSFSSCARAMPVQGWEASTHAAKHGRKKRSKACWNTQGCGHPMLHAKP